MITDALKQISCSDDGKEACTNIHSLLIPDLIHGCIGTLSPKLLSQVARLDTCGLNICSLIVCGEWTSGIGGVCEGGWTWSEAENTKHTLGFQIWARYEGRGGGPWKGNAPLLLESVLQCQNQEL